MEKNGRKAGIGTAVGTVGVAVGFVVPTLFVRYGDASSCLANALWFAVGGIAVTALLAPGVRETRAMIQRYMAERGEGAPKEAGFFKQMLGAMSNRDFLAFILLYFFYQAAMLSMTASVYYVGDYILGRSTTLIMAAMLGGALAGFAANPRSPEAILGIRLHQVGIPAALLLVGFVVFKALNTITPESARRNRELLKEKGW